MLESKGERRRRERDRGNRGREEREERKRGRERERIKRERMKRENEEVRGQNVAATWGDGITKPSTSAGMLTWCHYNMFTQKKNAPLMESRGGEVHQ